MIIKKAEILNNICYTELVYKRVNNKLDSEFSKFEIEKMLYNIIMNTTEKDFQKTGKNYYITNYNNNIRITVNSNTYRVITVDIIDKKKQNSL